MCCVDIGRRLDGQREVMQPRRVELELLRLERLPQAKRSRPRTREAQVVDPLTALTVEEGRFRKAERPKDGGIERERALEVAADEIDVTDADEH